MISPRARKLSLCIAAAYSLSGQPLWADEANSPAPRPATMIVMDGSGSMWGQIGGRTKLEIARDTAASVLGELPQDRVLGLMAYGHRERGNCADIEVMIPPAAGTSAEILAAVNKMRFQGKTPLTEAVRQAASVLRHSEEAATVVLITDGIETCAADPCAVANELESSGVDFTAHVIGFGLTRDQGAQVACIAENTGGRYLPASDAASLADAMRQVVAASPPAPPEVAPATVPIEESRHYPGGTWMEGFMISPTGYLLGPSLPEPAAGSFPDDGTAEACRAQCEGDAQCGSWRFEPGPVMLRDRNACFLYHPNTEFSLTLMPLTDGFVSGMKDGVKGLITPYIPYGGSADASLALTGPVRPGEEFAVLWTGPGLADDWVDIVPQGHEDFSGELSYFYSAETIEQGDKPEGSGLLMAPSEPGLYDLRYVMGRKPDRRILHRVTIGVGVDAPESTDAAGVQAGEALTELEVKITVPASYAGEVISWAATPLTPRAEAPEALAMPEAFAGEWQAALYPGRWRVEGLAASGMYFAATIDVSNAAGQSFEIPVGFESDGMGEDPAPDPAAPDTSETVSGAAEGAALLNPDLPEGWQMIEAFHAETAAGVRSSAITATFSGPSDQYLLLNPLQWLESNGSCEESGAGPLCLMGKADGSTDAARASILAAIGGKASPKAPDLGGTPFRSSNPDALQQIVPGWSVE